MMMTMMRLLIMMMLRIVLLMQVMMVVLVIRIMRHTICAVHLQSRAPLFSVDFSHAIGNSYEQIQLASVSASDNGYTFTVLSVLPSCIKSMRACRNAAAEL